MIKACVFDLDGTLADTLESMAYAANMITKKYGLKQLPVDNFRYYCGEGANVLMQRVLKDAGDPEGIHLEEGQKEYRNLFEADPMYHVRHYPGIPETIGILKRMGIKLAVCSNKPHPATVKVVETMFSDDFQVIVGQSAEFRRKPAPDIPLYIAEKMGVLPEECMYVGDTNTDMQTGKAAGMYTVGVLWGFRDEKELLEGGADTIAETPEDLLDILEEYNYD